jgi:NAD(P)-dependent dehydrogenase (short-subunit alcohol dehydrogenase family)
MELQDMSGRVCVVTGANSGIGRETAKGLARLGARVVMVCRHEGRGREAKESIEAAALQATGTNDGRVDLQIADLAVQDDIRRLSTALHEDYERLDVLVNNAGVFQGDRETTPDDMESTMAVNHLAPFLLTHLVLDRMKETAERHGEARIVTVSSEAHRGADISFDDLQSEEGYNALQAYSQSKLANIMFTYELARRLHGTGVTANCVHPGIVATNIFRDSDWFSRVARLFKAFYKNPEEGAEAPLYLAASPEVENVTGEYFKGTERVNASVAAYDEKRAARLWQRSLELTEYSPKNGEYASPDGAARVEAKLKTKEQKNSSS